MSEPTQTTKQIEIDAVAGYFQKRMQAAENDCLLYASQVRDLTNLVRQQNELIKRLQAAAESLRQPAAAVDTAEPKPRRKRPN
jgi:hypothetical protein